MIKFHPESSISNHMRTFLSTSIKRFIDDVEDFMNRTIIKDEWHLIDYGEQSLLHLYSQALQKLDPELLQLFEFGTDQSNRGDLLIQDSKNKKFILVEAKKHTSNPDAYKKWDEEIKSYYERITDQATKYLDYINLKIHDDGYHKLIMTLTFDTNPDHKHSGEDWSRYTPQLDNEYFYYKGFNEYNKGLAVYGIIFRTHTI